MFNFTKRAILVFILLALSAFPLTVVASNEVEGANPKSPVTQVCDGVWAGQGVAGSGEPIYFGLERIDDSNREDWEYYLSYAQGIVDSIHDPYALRGLVNKLREGGSAEIENIATNSLAQIRTGFTEKELSSHLQYMQKAIGGDLSALDISKATAACYLTIPGTCLAYISKKPVTGKYSSFPPKDKLDPWDKKYGYNGQFKLSEFVRSFGDILMTVGVYQTPWACAVYKTAPAYEIRGIFKNPHAVFEKNYKGISILLQAFTAAAMMQIACDKKYMVVSPIVSVHSLLCKNFKPNEMFVARRSADDDYVCGFVPAPTDLAILDDSESERKYVKETLETLPAINTGTYGEVVHLIKINALVRIYEDMGKEK